jgi:hypothetical protein
MSNNDINRLLANMQCGVIDTANRAVEKYQAKNKALKQENEKLKELVKMLRCDAVMALNGEWEVNDEGFQAQIEQIDAVVQFKED